MSRGAKRGSGTAATATAAGESSSSSSSRGGGGWTNNLRSLLFSPSPTKSPRRKSRSKSTTPPPKNKRLSRSARCSNNNTKDEPLAVLGAHPNYSLSLSKSSSSTSSSRSVGGGGSKKKTEASVRFRSFSTTSNNNHTSGKSLLCQSINRSPNYKFGPPAPSRDSENAQTVDKRQSLPVLSSLQQRPGGADTLTKKKMDSSSNSSVGSSNKYLYGGGAEKRRSFGEEIDGNHMVFDTSLLAVSMDSSTKDTTTAYNTSSSLSTGGGGGRGSNGGGGMMSVSFSAGDEDHTTVASSSDGGGAMTDASSSVAALRGWLGDFSKQQKKHYEEKSKAPTPDPAVKAPTRPRVGPPKHNNTKEVSVPEQPYVPAPSTTTLSSSTPAPAPPAVATPSVTKPGSLSHHNLHHMPNSHHHHHHPPASTLAKRLVDTGLSARSRTTPIRFKPKFQEDDVKATNEGYKSVAKLSAWLADDPTKPKKVRQIRRGANVIAKSKTFDKGLADVIVETHNIPTGHVREKKHLLETSICTHNDDDDEEEEAHGLWAGDPLPSSSVPHTPSTNTHHNSYYHRRQPQSTTRRGDHLETSSAINVNDKKAWLQNAFKKSDVESTSGRHSAAAAAATPGLRPKAKTDVITAQDQRDDVTARAKHLWRNRSTTTTTTTAATSSRQGVTFAPTEKSSNSSNGPVSMVSRLQSRGNRGEPTDMFRKQTSPTLNDNDVSMISLNTTNQNDESMISLETSYIEEDSTDFSAARSLIVERAKQNGCSDVAVMTKVKLRQQKFEKLQKDARRSSLPHGQLKPSWQSGGNGDDDDTRDHQDASLSPSRCYVKKYIDNAPPKKTLRDLP